MKNLMIIVIALLLVLIIGVGFTMYYVFSPTSSASASESIKEDDVIGYSTGSQFVTSMGNTRRFVKTDIVIEIQDKKAEKILEAYNYRIRDCILSILGDISEEEIEDKNLKENLKIEIKEALQNLLNIDSIKGIYFNEFVIQ